MKKLITLLFIFGLTNAVSAQFLLRTEKIKDKKGEYENKVVINLDTMPYIQFISILIKNTVEEGSRVSYVDIGDGYPWIWVNESTQTIRARGYVDILNKLTKQNWVFQLPYYKIDFYQDGTTSETQWLFKRRETK